MLRIAVCVKQVPSEKVMVAGEEGNLDRSQMKGSMNMYDYAALETALCIREQSGGSIDVFTMGPERAAETLREAMAYGADSAFLLNDCVFAGADVLATAYTLSCAINKAGPYDLIVCGLKTTDGDTAQVGGELAAMLNITYVPNMYKVNEVGDDFLKMGIITDNQKIIIRTALPVLLSVEPSACTVRTPTLAQRLKSRKREIQVWDSLDIEADCKRTGQSGSATKVVKLFSADKNGKEKKILQLSAEEAVSLIKGRIAAWTKIS